MFPLSEPVIEVPPTVVPIWVRFGPVPLNIPLWEPVKEPVSLEPATVEVFVKVPTEMLGVCTKPAVTVAKEEVPVRAPTREPVKEPVRCVSDTEQEFNRVDDVKGA